MCTYLGQQVALLTMTELMYSLYTQIYVCNITVVYVDRSTIYTMTVKLHYKLHSKLMPVIFTVNNIGLPRLFSECSICVYTNKILI